MLNKTVIVACLAAGCAISGCSQSKQKEASALGSQHQALVKEGWLVMYRADRTPVLVPKDMDVLFPSLAYENRRFAQVEARWVSATYAKDQSIQPLFEELSSLNRSVRDLAVSYYLGYVNSLLDADPTIRASGEARHEARLKALNEVVVVQAASTGKLDSIARPSNVMLPSYAAVQETEKKQGVANPREAAKADLQLAIKNLREKVTVLPAAEPAAKDKK